MVSPIATLNIVNQFVVPKAGKMTNPLFVKRNINFRFLVVFKSSFSQVKVSLQFMKECSLSIDRSPNWQERKKNINSKL